MKNISQQKPDDGSVWESSWDTSTLFLGIHAAAELYFITEVSTQSYVCGFILVKECGDIFSFYIWGFMTLYNTQIKLCAF